MNPRPDASTVLFGLAAFLEQDARPAIQDRALSFRVLVAANLARMLSAELLTERDRLDAQLRGLRTVLGPERVRDVTDAGLDTLRTAVTYADRELAAALRDPSAATELVRAATEYARATLRDALAISNPGFALDDDVP